jgi:hypothetical protein
MIFIGVIFHPGAQLVGIAACGLALLVSSLRAAFSRGGTNLVLRHAVGPPIHSRHD